MTEVVVAVEVQVLAIVGVGEAEQASPWASHCIDSVVPAVVVHQRLKRRQGRRQQLQPEGLQQQMRVWRPRQEEVPLWTAFRAEPD